MDSVGWVAAYCEPARELYARNKLRDKGFETFCPFERITRRRAVAGRPGQFRPITVEVALFAPYLFVRTDRFFETETTPGVISLVKTEGRPVQIRESVVDKLKQLADDNGLVSSKDITKPSYWFGGKVGDKVEFGKNSPLYGLLGVISSVARIDVHAEVGVTVELFGSSREVVIPVEKVGVVRHRDRV